MTSCGDNTGLGEGTIICGRRQLLVRSRNIQGKWDNNVTGLFKAGDLGGGLLNGRLLLGGDRWLVNSYSTRLGSIYS